VTYCPRCATPLATREQAGRTRAVCPACGFVHYQNPLPVAACLVEAVGGLYLIRRRFEPGQGRWGLPAGYVEVDETPADAAARETLEETGLVVSVDALVGVYPYRERGGPRSGIVIAYHGVVTGGEPEPGDDAAAVMWFQPAGLPADLAFDTHRAALRDWLIRAGLPLPAWLMPPTDR
jgi:ADP-ribose pyrophosphatase YjhB (NUDIX family)